MRKHHLDRKTKSEDKELSRIIKAVKGGKLDGPTDFNDLSLRPVSKNRRAIAKTLEAVAAKAGLDAAKIDKLLAEDQKKVRADFDKEKAAAAKSSKAAALGFAVPWPSVKRRWVCSRPRTSPASSR